MTYIRKMVFENFKSFAGRVEMPLEKEFNAIIGPNGAGKSNIIDGLAFVLGSRSSNIRADRLVHVIFNGGQGRKPADYALVEIHLDNSARTIPGYDEHDVVIISRRVDRSGRSTFKINGKTVTRRKLVEVLRSVGIDAESFNIIQQGDITRLLEMRPKERREIIDDIAGIREYNEKKEKALKELEKAERRLEEAEILLEEKRKIVEKLKQERDAALEYKKLEEKLDVLKATLAYSKLKTLESMLESVTRNLEIKEKELGAMKDSTSGEEEEIEKLEKEIERINQEIVEKSVNAELRREIEELVARINKRYAKLESLKRERKNVEDMITHLKHVSSAIDTENRALNQLLALGMEGVVGTVVSLMRVDEKFRKAIEVAAGNHLDDVVVESEDVAVQAINYLKRERLGRLRFLPLDRLEDYRISGKAEQAAKMAGIIDFAINLIQFDKKYERVFRYVFRDTLVAEDMESARHVRGVRVVTLDGELFEPSGAIIGGYLKESKRALRAVELAKISEYERKLAELDKEMKELEQEIRDLSILLEEKRNSEREESEEVRKLEAKKKEIMERLAHLKEQRRFKVEQRLRLEAEVNQLKIRKARIEGELENIKLEYEKYREREGELKVKDPQQLQAEIRTVEMRMRVLAPVNLKAIEDYEIFSKEYEEFLEKVRKLREERTRIISMIEEIEEKRKKVFMETLKGLNEKFNRVYDELVGGSVELRLEREDDIESGLLINIRPKNKKITSIDALSGGEKTMVAIAFLFAVQQYKPYPFYALDEVDAALDAVNSEKLGDLIDLYSKRSQFIVISHNDITVRKASRIYGVVMEGGVSRIFGVKFDENGKLVLEGKVSARAKAGAG